MFRILQLFSIQRRLGLIFLAFLGLLVISVTLTFEGLETQKQDVRIINLAGRQRMLLQQMNGLAQSTANDEGNESISSLQNAATTFEQTLMALRGDSSILDYTGERFEPPRSASSALQFELDVLQKKWLAYRSNIDRLAQSSDPAITQKIIKQMEGLSPSVLEQADRVVRAFESVSTARVARLRAFQIISLLVGLALLSAGWWITSISIVRPLNHIEQSAQQIGEGNLSSPILLQGPSEVQVLGSAMEKMRQQIQASRLDSLQWAEMLESRVYQRTRELEALSTVSREINSHLAIEDVLTSVTEKARDLLQAEVASLCLLDSDEKVLCLRAAAAPEPAIQKNQSPADTPVVGTVLNQHCAHPCGLRNRQGFCLIIAPSYRVSHLAAPLYSRDKVIGALCVGSSKPDAFRPEMATVLTQLSDSASVALENSRLYEHAEFAATLEERQRIASEMHDGLLQTLSFLRLMVQLLEDQLVMGESVKAQATLCQIKRAEEQGESEIRRAIASLQDDYPLNDTLQERLIVLAKELSITSPPIAFESRIVIPLVLSRQESEQVLRVAREALLNAQHHSKAETINIYLDKSGNEMVLSVQDQGVGFAPNAHSNDGRAHFGLKIMQARAARLGGKLMIQSSPGTGTLVELRWTPTTAHPMGEEEVWRRSGY